ncbi:hypothetical protein GCM10011369_03620 [Neiella marina]|uniref:histidine kinase n=1 Tax=Neiella marina TaxID=508461 RepID=A0A8J2U227_9GAMM|nr:response regulator [Neiella marina]GGA65422.1 hypothetical protein GCM10011369_03620 [Neiella marina]
MLTKNTVVLVVEDIEVMRKITADQVIQYGPQKVLQASNGKEALQVLQNNRVDLIVSDWNMPLMDGLELLRRVRQNPHWQRIPFVMVTSESEGTKVKLAVHYGVSEIVVKPFTPAILRSRLIRAVRNPVRVPLQLSEQQPLAAEPEQASEDAAQGSIDSKDGSLLIVDDTPDTLLHLSTLLKDKYRVRLANNGQKALAICRSDDQPDLVLLDIMMPEISGYDVLNKLRQSPVTENIPVILVTAVHGLDAEIKGTELGAIEYITKPVDPVLLLSKVRNFMHHVRRLHRLQDSYDFMVSAAVARDSAEQLMRHDIKAPLSAILALAEQINSKAGHRDSIADLAKNVETTTRQVLSLVARSVDLYKIEMGLFEYQAKAVDLVKVLKLVIDNCKSVYQVKQLTCNLYWDANAISRKQLMVSAEDTLLYAVSSNLIKNAFEAARERTAVQVSLSLAQNNTLVKCSIRNDGMVPTNIRHCFFDKYVTSGKRLGSGLGTYSAKLMVEVMGGKIAMQCDDQEQTTTVDFSLPVVS